MSCTLNLVLLILLRVRYSEPHKKGGRRGKASSKGILSILSFFTVGIPPVAIHELDISP